MKKTVILILAVLPIFLLITIAFAGRILALYQHIPVEKVLFVDQYNTPWSSEDFLVLEANTTAETKIKIYPELASNKEVKYSVLDASICSIDDKGVITGIAHGDTEVYVETVDRGQTSTLKVRVTEYRVRGVELDKTEVTLNPGDGTKLTATVLGRFAEERAVSYSSSDPKTVKVNQKGEITALASGTATVTVTTKEGGYTATCLVTVLEGKAAIAFDFSSLMTITESGSLLHTSVPSVNVLDYLEIDDTKIDLEEVQIYIKSGGRYATLTDGVLTITKQEQLVTVVAYVGDKDTPDYGVSIIFVYKSLAFDFSNATAMEKHGEFMYTTATEINLQDYLTVNNTKIKPEDIKYYIEGGDGFTTISEDGTLTIITPNESITIATLSEDGTLTIITPNESITVTVYVGNKATPTYKNSVKFVLSP